MPLEEALVDLFDQRVDADVFLVVLAGSRERQFGDGRRGAGTPASRKNAYESDSRPGRIADAAVQVEHRQPVEGLPFDVLVQVQLERFLQRPGRRHVGVVALVADADVLERLAVEAQDRLPRPGEIDAERVAVRALRLSPAAGQSPAVQVQSAER